jgi:hypothetical protein
VCCVSSHDIDLVAGCAQGHCLQMGWQLKRQLDPAYSRGAAVMDITGGFPQFVEGRRTARKRAGRALRFGYRFSEVDRPAYTQDIHDVNTSKRERQGRPMTAGYLQKGVYSPIPMVCPSHHVYTYGILDPDDTLRAYLWLYRSGQLAMVSSILGHADHLENGVMYLLYLGMLEQQWPLGGTVFYNRWDSGTDGLRFFKERVGLHQGDVAWAPV